MFRWYQEATKCYVYMADVVDLESGFQSSVWFSRGWTLQELIAPGTVEFYASDEAFLGTRSSLELLINKATRISLNALRGENLAKISVDERLSWAVNRKTGQEEDQAYCQCAICAVTLQTNQLTSSSIGLLGISDVSMPIIYGEGRKRASNRLYDEIQRYTSSTYTQIL